MDAPFWIRKDGAVAFDHEATLTIVGADGVARRFADASADVMRAALEHFWTPRSQRDLEEHLRDLSGQSDPALCAELVKVLAEAGAIGPAAPSAKEQGPASVLTQSRGRIVLGVCGAA